MARIAIGIEYDGSAFRGWQQQAHARSVQGELQRALGEVAAHPVDLTAAGRTDAGVHAIMQVAHFDTSAARALHAWSLGGTSAAADDVSILWAHEVQGHFHARHAAISRTYVYRVLNRPMRAALDRLRVCWVRHPLDESAMQAAAGPLLGEQDFSAFRAAECQSRTPRRRLLSVRVERLGDIVEITVCANAFLHHMVRNIAGSLLQVGAGARPAGWIGEVLESRDRTRAGPTAPPQGLYFAGVEYPDEFALPSCARRSGRLWPGFPGDVP